VKTLLVYIDANRKTTNEFGSHLPGARPHVRIRVQRPPASTQRVVAALPRNFYNQVWYDSLTEIQQVQLGAREPIELPTVDGARDFCKLQVIPPSVTNLRAIGLSVIPDLDVHWYMMA
jgi:hypothetical protein